MDDHLTDETALVPVSGGGEADGVDIPSCQGCRKRKLKCSREQPACSHCKRLDGPCEYDLTKNKPGIKLGAVGSLSRRVEILEDAVLKPREQQGRGPEAVNGSGDNNSNVVEVLSMLARELHKLNSARRLPSHPGSPEAVISPATSHNTATTRAVDGVHNQPRKRRRVDSCGNPTINLAFPLEDLENNSTTLPPSALLEDVVTAYFNFVQPWIPLLHETQFRRRLHNHERVPELVVVLHAMVVAAVRFVDHAEHQVSTVQIEQMTTRSRNLVVLSAMNSLSVESLQALVIIAFTDIGNGEASKTWSIIGSLTRTVEYLQLSVETDDDASEPLLKPLPSIPPAQNWTEEEERRRVFWTIFCLDRLCSVSTGWNTSLTADDVRRRLPADGGLWHKEEAVSTPYFGIWDRSAARIGNSITFLPGHYPSPDQAPEAAAAQSTGPNTVDMTTVGAFAYCIEATESLSRVTTYFLRQKINFDDRQEVSSWLTRFKELDLRLVHWKMFLPQKWRDSNISRQPPHIDMDPNLTLAHVTHNTSMILLHQRIAYPEAQWADIVRLPSFCSAETCQVAAVETATITNKYLRYKPDGSPVNNQFAFCVFINARVLLVHWRRYGVRLASEFWTLVDSLDDMARRWAGPGFKHLSHQSLPGKYAAHLRGLHRRCQSDPAYAIDVLGYSSPINLPSNQSPAATDGVSPRATVQLLSEKPVAAVPFPDAVLDGLSAGPFTGFPVQDMEGQGHQQPDELSAISHLLMDQQFMSMDRIISFDDNLFTATSSGGLTWQN